MLRLRAGLLALILIACGADAPPAAGPVAPKAAMTPPTTKPAPLVAADIDPVAFGLGRDTTGPGNDGDVARASDGIERLCDQNLTRARALLEETRALETKGDANLTWDTTLGKLDRMRAALRNAGDFPALMAVAHPDEGVRNKAKACEPRVEEFETALWLDAKVARVVKRYAAKKENLPGPRARMLAHVLRDFRRNGLDLDEKAQARLREINTELTKLGQAFDTNLADSHLTVEATAAELDGLPKEWLASHAPGANGKISISTDYPDYFPVLQYAKNRKVALALYKQFENRAADKNVAVLEKVLTLRGEKAKMLGYATWADYVLEPRMAKDRKTVSAFLESIKTHLAKKGADELAEARAMHVKLGGKATDPIPPSDRLYLEDQVRRAKYGLDSKEVSQYFEVTRVKEGLLTITSKLFGVRYRRIDAPTWHSDVEAMEVTDLTGKVLGRFYFDLYPRDGKYKHAAVFSIRDTIRLDNGSRLVPIAAIECNFPKPGGAAPALMSHHDVVTFFHEFGHVIHHVLSESELSWFAGTSVARDFVEAPSQMLEEWAWSKETLDLFAAHHDKGTPIPPALHAAMLKSRSFGRALGTQRQLFLAALDQTYHTRPMPFDTTKALAEVNDAYTPFKYVEGTHFQASFGHLIGYDAGYYGYQWALSIAQDLFTRFQKEGMMNEKTAAEYRAAILSRGGADDEENLVKTFLGRPTNDTAFKAFLVK